MVKTNQAFRPHVLDMFEPQDHPDDFKIPGGAPTPPYDNAGWTLAMQMGVQFDRVLDAFTGPFEKVKEDVSPMVATTVAEGEGRLLHPSRSERRRHRQQPHGEGGSADVPRPEWIQGRHGELPGWYVVRSGWRGRGERLCSRRRRNWASRLPRRASKPAGAQPVKPTRVALIDRYGGNMPTGWTRLVMDKFEVPYTLVYPQELDKGGLKAKYDVIVLTDGMVSDGVGRGGGGGGFGGSPDTMLTPAQYRNRLGRISTETTVPKLKEFMEAGGRIITIGSSIALGKQIGLPIDNYLMDGTRPLGREKYYIPGSLLEVKMDTSAMITTGMPARPIVMFDNSPVMKLGADAAAKGVRSLAMFDTDAPLKSGWAWGQNYLKGGVAIAEAKVGQGNLYLFGPEILFRSQPHGTYKLLLNALTLGFDRPVKTGVM